MNSHMLSFSVIIPVYNTPPEYLKKCLDSCICQKSDNMEVILVDDGSEQYCRDICMRYAEKHQRIRYIRQENKGASVARNTGLENAKGEYILFLDADDWLSDSFLNSVESQMQGKHSDVILYGYRSEYKNRHIDRYLSPKVIPMLDSSALTNSALRISNTFAPFDVGAICAKLIRRELLEEKQIRFIPGIKRGQDTLFMLYVYYHSRKFSYIPQIGYHYRRNDGSVTHKLNPSIVSIMESLFEQYGKFLKYAGRDNEVNRIQSTARFRMLFGEYLSLYFCHPDNPKTERELRNEYLELINKEPYSRVVAEMKADGLYVKIRRFILKKKWLGIIWLLKKVEQLLRRKLLITYE